MGATSIKSRIKDLLTDVTVDNTAIGQFATDAAKEIINVLPMEMLWSLSTSTPDINGGGAALTSTRILYASRLKYRAVEINASDAARVTDNNSIYKATNESPVFYKEAGKVFIEPKVNNNTSCLVHHVNYPTIVYNDDMALADFVGAPDEIEHLIILKTAVKARLSELNEFQDDSEEHGLKMQDLQLLQQEYAGALSTFLSGTQRREGNEEA
jgi:hypothetical protein